MCEEKQESAKTKQPRTYEEIKAARVDSDAISICPVCKQHTFWMMAAMINVLFVIG